MLDLNPQYFALMQKTLFDNGLTEVQRANAQFALYSNRYYQGDLTAIASGGMPAQQLAAPVERGGDKS